MFVINKKKIIEFRNQYNATGLLVVKKFFNESYIKKIKKIVGNLKMHDADHYFEKSCINKKKILVRSENFFNKNNELTKLVNNKLIHNILKLLHNQNFVVFKEKINYKPPGCRSDRLHQDIQAKWDDFSRNHVSVLISIDPSNKNNSPLKFDISGNNKNIIRGQYFKPLRIKDLKKPFFKTYKTEKGDVLFFNSYVPHSSSANLSKFNRMQIYLTYNPKKEGNFREEYINKKKISYPPNNLRDNISQYKYKV
jgi:ectoine hydroxylase-related dioxygenase (phytanoyl-CoA dioxygenase family)